MQLSVQVILSRWTVEELMPEISLFAVSYEPLLSTTVVEVPACQATLL